MEYSSSQTSADPPLLLLTHAFRSRGNNSPFLRGDDEQIVEEEKVDGVELHPHVEEGRPFGHFLQLALLLQVPGLGDDRDGLEENAQLAKRPVSQTLATRRPFLGAYLEFVKLQRLADEDQLLHLSHLPHLRVALVNDLETQRLRSDSRRATG